MTTVLRNLDVNVVNQHQKTPEKKTLRRHLQADKSAKKYRAADLLDIALKHERNGNKELALSSYEDAAESISNNAKILAKIGMLKTQIASDFEKLQAEKKKMIQEAEAANRLAQQFASVDEIDSFGYDMGDNNDDDISVITDNQDNDSESVGDADNDDMTDATFYSEYDPVKRAETLANLQSKTLSALEYQLLDRLNKGEKDELVQLIKIGEVRASKILELREELYEKASGAGTYFTNLDQLEDIDMKPKEIKSFLKQNATFLLGI